MTPQEAFDKSTRGIIAQGGPATGAAGNCLYIAPDGRRCAVGQLLDEIRPAWNDETLGDVMQEAELELDFYVARQLQNCHDNASTAAEIGMDFWSEWRRRLKDLADKLNLDQAVLIEIPEQPQT